MNSERRNFVKKALVLGTASSFLSSGVSANNVAMKERIGIITNTIKSELSEDYRSTLQLIAEVGYKYIEGSFVPEGTTLKTYSNYLNSLGLSTVATGVGMRNLEQGELNQYLKKAEALRANYLVCYYPWLNAAENLTSDEVLRTAERLNTYGKQIKEAGFRFAWHNHDKEFVDIDGEVAFDTLMKNTDPEYVTVEMDWYWVVKGGQNPVTYFSRYPGRFELAHVKDMNNNRDEGITCVGNGIINFKPILNQAAKGGAKYYIVENERAVKGMKCAKESYQHLSEILQ